MVVVRNKLIKCGTKINQCAICNIIDDIDVAGYIKNEYSQQPKSIKRIISG